jgi:hypothetical protein
MFDGAVAQPLQNWFLRRLALVHQGVIHVARLFSLSRQTVRAAQVGLLSEHHKKFSLLSIGCVFRYPRRDLLHRRKLGRVGLNALADSARGSDGSNGSCGSCHKEQ